MSSLSRLAASKKLPLHERSPNTKGLPGEVKKVWDLVIADTHKIGLPLSRLDWGRKDDLLYYYIGDGKGEFPLLVYQGSPSGGHPEWFEKEKGDMGGEYRINAIQALKIAKEYWTRHYTKGRGGTWGAKEKQQSSRDKVKMGHVLGEGSAPQGEEAMNNRSARLLKESARRRGLKESAFGDFRRADPKNAPKPFIVVHKAAKKYFDALASALNELHTDEVALVHALHGLNTTIKKAGFDPTEVAPMSGALMSMVAAVANNNKTASHADLLELLRKFLKSDEMALGISPVRF